MSLGKKIFVVITSILMLLLAVDLFFEDVYGYYFIITVLVIYLAIRAVQSVWFYFSMARHMVGGLFHFYQAVLFVDLMLFAPVLLYAPRWVMVLYLNGMIIFSGIVDILGAREQKKMMWPRWKLKMSLGISKVVFAIAAMIFMNAPERLAMVYAVALAYTAIMRVIDVFRARNVAYYTQ